MDPKTAALIWQDDGSPRSLLFDDPYFSAEGGLAEARHVFLAGNNLPARFAPGFHIAELGFGTGLNMLAAWQAWQQCDVRGPLCFTSFEAFPMTRANLKKALQTWPELSALAEPLISAWPCTRLSLPDLELHIIIGDAAANLPRWESKADAWFLDGFSPVKNPEMWTENLMHIVGAKTNPNGSFATYTAAGHVRRALAGAGFRVNRTKGFGRKRHMTRAVLA